jgi:hypothetical protein
MSPLVVAREEQEGEVVRIMEEWIMEHEQVLHWDRKNHCNTVEGRAYTCTANWPQ